MSKMINIPSYIQDPNYRYKMPQIQLKIEGKGNGIKTNLVNLDDVAKYLRVPAEYPLKFMGHELGSQTIYKSTGNEVTTIINGEFKENVIYGLVDKFCEKFVVCSKCTYPEIIIKVKKGVVIGDCQACGVKAELDNQHKVSVFIVKNPPTNKSEFKKDGDEKKDKKSKKKEKDEKPSKQIENQDEKPEKSKKKTEKSEKIQQEQVDIQKLDVSSELFEEICQVITECYHELCQENDDDDFDDNDEAVKVLYKKVKSLGIKKKQRICYIIFNSLFDLNIAKNIQKNAYLINELNKKFKLDDIESQVNLMSNLQYFLLQKHAKLELNKYIATILKLFYDQELFTEEYLIKWFDNVDQGEESINSHFLYSSKINEQFKIDSQQLIQWLKQSE